VTSKPSAATADADIRALIDGWAKAIRAKDANGVMAHYAADSVTFDLAPPLVSTRTDAKGLQAWFATWRGPIGYEIRDLHVTVGNGAAFCHSLCRLSGTTTDGEKNDVWFRLTLGFRRIRGAWKIAHQNESVPFYMDGSYRAAVDLTP
jgi:PhnB protein